MKKVVKYVSFVLALLCFAVSLNIFAPKNMASADTSSIAGSAEFYNTANSILNSYVQYKDRIAGSTGEKQAAEYIINFLDNSTEALPLINDYIENGVQSFRFYSTLDGEYHTSQNIIYTHSAKVKTENKVIIGCSYDALAFEFGSYQLTGELVASESVNGSAGSVALLLTLAKYLSNQNFDFNIEFIFFGAGESNNAGSNFYTQGISKDDAKNIILMINIDKVALGKNTYFYVDEIDNDFSKYVKDLSSNNKLGIKKVSTSNLGKTLVEGDKLGLNYTHIALTSNNVNFMSSNVLTMNIFAGDYSSGITMGLCEYGENDILTYTNYDNLDYIATTYGVNEVIDNLFVAFNSIQTILSDSNFTTVCLSSVGQTNWLYSIFTNQKLLALLVVVIAILFIGVGYIINFKLSKKAYYANVDIEFVKAVVNISENIDNTSVSAEIPEVVSEILVRDIKNDKKIKKKK